MQTFATTLTLRLLLLMKKDTIDTRQWSLGFN